MSSGYRQRSLPVGRIAAVMVLFFAFVVAINPTGFGSAAQDQSTEPDATIRVVNASPGAPNLDVIVDGAPLFTDVAFGSATEYAPIAAGDHQIQFVPTGEGTDAALIDEEKEFDSGAALILAAVNNLSDIELKQYDVDLDAVDEGKALVRAINVAPDTEGLNVSVTGGDELFSGLDFNDVSDYEDQDPGVYDLDIGRDDEQPLASATGVEFLEGHVHDLFILGSSEGTELTFLSLVTSTSPSCSEVLGVGGAEDACVRVVNADAGAQELDFLVNESPIATGVAFGTASDFAAIPAGDDREFVVVPVGGDPADSIADETESLDPGQAYLVVLAGRTDDEDLLIKEVDLTPLPEGQSRVRMIQASQDTDEGDLVVTDGDELFGGISYKDATDYKTVDSGTYDLQFQVDDEILVRATAVQLKENMTSELVLIGSREDGSLELVLIESPAASREGGVSTPVSGTPGAGEPIATPEVVGTPVS
jgi:hypothetical protein